MPSLADAGSVMRSIYSKLPQLFYENLLKECCGSISLKKLRISFRTRRVGMHITIGKALLVKNVKYGLPRWRSG